MTNEEALSKIEELIQTGILRIITSEHLCNGGGTEPSTSQALMTCKSYEYSTLDPRHFVCHVVTGLRLLRDSWVQVLSDEGDMCSGSPIAVLKKCLEFAWITKQSDGMLSVINDEERVRIMGTLDIDGMMIGAGIE